MLNFFSEYWKHHAVSLESRCGKWGTNKVNRELSSSSPQQLGLGGCELLAQQSAAIRRATGQFTFFLCWKQGFFSFYCFVSTCYPQKRENFHFFFSARQLFWCFRIQNGKARDQVDFYPECFASCLAQSSRGVFPASLGNRAVILSLKAFTLPNNIILPWYFTISCCFEQDHGLQ